MSSRRKLKKKNAKVDADHTTSLLRGDSKRVSIARGPQVTIAFAFDLIVECHSFETRFLGRNSVLAKISTML